MRKAVQAMRSAGEIERYNSLRQKEKHEDERIEQHLIDLNVANNQHQVKNQQVKIVKTVTSMIDKKKVFLDGYLGGAANGNAKTTSIISHRNIEIEKTVTTTTTSTRPTN